MSRKKKGRKRRAPAHRPSPSLRPGDRPAAAAQALPERRVLEVRSLLEQGRRGEAREMLEKLRALYPRDRLLLVTLMAVCQEMGDWRAVLETSLRILELHPDTPDAYYYLTSACLLNGWPISAAEHLREFLARWPQHPQAPQASRTLAEIETSLPQLLEELLGPHARLPEDQRLELGRRHEEVQLRLAVGRFEEVKAAAQALLQRWPGFVQARNNLGLAQWTTGDTDQAIGTCREVLAGDPRNVHALSNLVRFLAAGGREEEAGEYGPRLREAPSPDPLDRLKKMEGLAFLGDDRGVVEVYEKDSRSGFSGHDLNGALFYHLAATACCRLGDERKARRLWKKALSLSRAFQPAQANLEDLGQPPGERNGPWYFELSYWLPPRLFETVQSVALRAAGRPGGLLEKLGEFARRHPAVVRVMIPLAERGSPLGREYCLRLAVLVEDEQVLSSLRALALGPAGSDPLRLRLLEVLQAKGAVPPGLVRVWLEGEPVEIFAGDFEIHDEPSPRLEGEAQRLSEKGHSLLRQGQAARGEETLRQALALAPDSPAVLNNLAVALELQGRGDEARRIAYQTHERHPDYLFARTAVAADLAERGKPEEARYLLRPLLERRRFHRSEFAAVCAAMVRILIHEKKLKGALQWLELLRRVEPHHPFLHLMENTLSGPGNPSRRFPKPGA